MAKILSLWLAVSATGTLNLGAIRNRTWRQQPRDPKTGQPSSKLILHSVDGLFFLFIMLGLVLGVGVVVN